MAKDEEKRKPDEEHSRKKEESAAEDEEREDEEDGEADDEDDGDDEAGEDQDGDDDAEDEPAVKAEPKPEPKAEAKPAKAGRPARPRPLRAPPPPPSPATSLGKRVIAFVAVLLVLTSGFWLLSGFDSGLDKPVVKWRVGQLVELDITLVKEDAMNLACSSAQDVAGKKCEWNGKDKNTGVTDATMLKPYTTIDGVNFVAAGVWNQPALDKAKLPNDRFSVHCKYKVEGMLKTPMIRWNPSAPWGEKKEDWYAGTVSDCKMNPP